MILEDVDTTAVCVDYCGARCCTGGAFVRPADASVLREVGAGAAVADERPLTKTDESNECILLGDDGCCIVYENRPLDCRLFPLGFRLDDEARRIEITLALCPLAKTISEEATDKLVERARQLLTKFDGESLRAYDQLPFTTEVTAIETIPYDEAPVQL